MMRIMNTYHWLLDQILSAVPEQWNFINASVLKRSYACEQKISMMKLCSLPVVFMTSEYHIEIYHNKN